MRPFHSFVFASICLFLTGCGADLPDAVLAEMDKLPARVDFNQHIRPILSDRCWKCHGPDEKARQADLRLDTEAGAFAALASGEGFAFNRGKPGSSEVIHRLISEDPETVMPPPESNMTVSAKEIALITRWIDQGAVWKDHWAFLPIVAPEIPANPPAYTAANQIDHFINARLQLEELPANERADDERLLRRLHLDLTGLPPSPEEMDSWLAAPTEENYTAIVDKLLQTDAHAERMTMEWLDLARYADSHGMHADGWRLSWPYRDWVINAYRDNMPFDQFVREQVAGDLLPESGQAQKIASAFNRMHPMTAEGGVIGEEMRLTYVFDRVNTVATGMLGLTMDCSRCHDHKFDPLSQSEYYSFSAFFNNFRELGMTGDDGNFGPYLLLADEPTAGILSGYKEQLQALKAERAKVAVNPEELARFLATESVRPPRPDHHLPMNSIKRNKDQSQSVDDLSWATPSFALVEDKEMGRVAEFDVVFDDLFFNDGLGQSGTTDPYTAALYVKTNQRDSALNQTLLGTAAGKNQAWEGTEFFLDEENRPNLRFIRTMPDDLIHIRGKDSIRTGSWQHLAYTYDGSGEALGCRLFIDGKELEHEVLVDNLRGEFFPYSNESWRKSPSRKVRIGQANRAFTGENGIFIGWMDDIRLYHQELSPLEISRLANPDLLASPELAQRHLLTNQPGYINLSNQIRKIKSMEVAISDTLPRLMVSQEMQHPRSTYRLFRGAYDAPAEEVFPTTPKQILPYPENFPKNRLGLAEWILLPENPLTARVAVNRYWQLIFGRGIVDTPHDFGSQGSLPSHPDLLDYLATEFRNNGWDVRALLREMVLSEAYRRKSHSTEEQRESDPDNALLARGPSSRLPAEMIRDNALAASGLLVNKVGGPSVKPYQPEGLWFQSNNFSQMLLHYVPDHGDGLYRRSMYTFIKRTAPPPFMTNFDATGRDVCLVKRSKTNTPLQALTLLNDPQFVEAARVLAQRIQAEGDGLEEQLSHAFRLVNGRKIRSEELAVLQQLYEEELVRFSAAPMLADSLLSVGEFPVPTELNHLKTAALTSVGNVLFSFDEAYVKR